MNKVFFDKFKINLVLVLLNFNFCIAQIIYTDIPDYTPNASFSLDLNNDSFEDYLIQFAAIDKIICIPINNNEFSGNIVNGIISPWALNQDTNICSSLSTWYNSNNSGTMAFGVNVGNWINANDKFLALKFKIGSNTHYGWARLDIIQASTTFVIKDFAYNSIPDTCILARQTTLSNSKNDVALQFSISPNPFSSYTIIDSNYNFKSASIIIFNSLGQKVKIIENISGNSFTLHNENLTKGFYLIEIMEDNKVLGIEKLIIN